MKAHIKRLLSVALTVVLTVLFGLASLAASGNGYGIEADVVAQGGALTVTVTNCNSFTVDGVSVAFSLPEGLTASSPLKSEAKSLAARESISVPITLNAGVSSCAANTDACDCLLLIILIVAAFAAALIIVLRLVSKKKKARAAVASVICLCLMLPSFAVFSVNAVGVGVEDSFTLTQSVEISSKKYEIGVTVSYLADSSKETYFDISAEAEQKNETVVTDPELLLGGTALSRGSVGKVEYLVSSEVDDYKNAVSGEAELSGCEFDAGKVLLKPGKNKITVTATDSKGQKTQETYVITYDSGETYQYNITEVSLEKDGTKFLNNIVAVYFENDTPQARREEIAASVGGEIVGRLNGVEMCQIRVKSASLEELEKTCAELNGLPEVVSAVTERFVSLEEQAVTNDPWSNTSGGSTVWNEALPSGNNWSVEAVQALSAWDYDSYFSHVSIGVLDSGFKLNHEDLSGVFNTSGLIGNSPANHGTHVTGIMAANDNNATGVTGLLWDTTVYCAVYSSSSSDVLSDIIASIAQEIESGAKSVNLSVGLSPKNFGESYSPEDLLDQVLACAASINALINNGREFVIVQSAGNGAYDPRLGSDSSSAENKRSIDALQNGLYSSVTESVLTDNNYTVAQAQAIIDRIIVVGAVTNNTTVNSARFVQNYYSNAGSRVDICAPGGSVYSCINTTVQNGVTYNYASMSGTSMAAPIVTAIAGMCFSVNPNLTGAQVKEMVCSEENTCYDAEDNTQTKTVDGFVYELHPLVNTYRVVNAKLAVEAALKTVCGPASYTYLNSIVAAANDLDPTDYYDFSSVTDIISSIDYSLYSFKQSVVDAKAQQLINALDALVPHEKADYSAVTDAIAAVNLMSRGLYVSFDAVDAAVDAVVYGKYIEDQTAVDLMAQEINDAIAALERRMTVVSAIPSEVAVDNTHQLVVITTDDAESFFSNLSVNGGGTLSFTSFNGAKSTGSKVNVVSNGETVGEYTVVAIGDCDGDGRVDGFDAYLVGIAGDGLSEQPDFAHGVAADINGDGIVDIEDVSLILQTGLRKYTPAVNAQ